MMHSKLPQIHPEIPTAAPGDERNLLHWLSDPRGEQFFGKAFRLRADVLAALLTSRPLAQVAREHHVTPEAARKYARLARAIYPTLNATKS